MRGVRAPRFGEKSMSRRAAQADRNYCLNCCRLFEGKPYQKV